MWCARVQLDPSAAADVVSSFFVSLLGKVVGVLDFSRRRTMTAHAGIRGAHRPHPQRVPRAQATTNPRRPDGNPWARRESTGDVADGVADDRAPVPDQVDHDRRRHQPDQFGDGRDHLARTPRRHGGSRRLVEPTVCSRSPRGLVGSAEPLLRHCAPTPDGSMPSESAAGLPNSSSARATISRRPSAGPGRRTPTASMRSSLPICRGDPRPQRRRPGHRPGRRPAPTAPGPAANDGQGPGVRPRTRPRTEPRSRPSTAWQTPYVTLTRSTGTLTVVQRGPISSFFGREWTRRTVSKSDLQRSEPPFLVLSTITAVGIDLAQPVAALCATIQTISRGDVPEDPTAVGANGNPPFLVCPTIAG